MNVDVPTEDSDGLSRGGRVPAVIKIGEMMPIYEYKCNDCDQKFELLRSCSDNSDIVCPECGKGNVIKMFSAFSGGVSGSTSRGCAASGGFS